MKIPFRHHQRSLLLGLAAASVIGWGCAVPVKVATERDTTAETVYLPAAEKNDAIAQLQLALAYRFGTAGASKDPVQAWKWLKRSANSGLLEAQLMLGDALVAGSWDQKQDVEAGLAVLRTAAQGGRRDVQTHLAMTLRDTGNSAHQTEAAMWFEKAARAGNKYAAMQLGQLYDRGLGVKRDAVLAYAWFAIAKDAINQGRLEAVLGKRDRSRAQQQLAQLRGEIGQ